MRRGAHYSRAFRAAEHSAASGYDGRPFDRAAVIQMVILHTTHGDIRLDLDAEKAPATVENFLSYAREGFYDGTIFHRVIEDFMIQGGGFTPDMNQKDTK